MAEALIQLYLQKQSMGTSFKTPDLDSKGQSFKKLRTAVAIRRQKTDDLE